MAYADTLDTNRRLGALGAVAAIHVMIGYALVAGLAAKYFPHPAPPRIVADNIRLPEPKPVEPQPVVDPAPRTTVVHETRSVVPLDMPSFTPVVEAGEALGAAGGTGHDIAEVRIPLPDPPPVPTLVRGAVPRGNPGLWVTPDDYPAADLRQDHAGVTRFRLAIGTDGRVKSCTITTTSGHPGLDQAACAKLTARGRFDPAIDSTGARLEGTYSSSVRWQIPE